MSVDQNQLTESEQFIEADWYPDNSNAKGS